MSLQQFREAARTAIIIAREEQNSGDTVAAVSNRTFIKCIFYVLHASHYTCCMLVTTFQQFSCISYQLLLHKLSNNPVARL